MKKHQALIQVPVTKRSWLLMEVCTILHVVYYNVIEPAQKSLHSATNSRGVLFPLLCYSNHTVGYLIVLPRRGRDFLGQSHYRV